MSQEPHETRPTIFERICMIIFRKNLKQLRRDYDNDLPKTKDAYDETAALKPEYNDFIPTVDIRQQKLDIIDGDPAFDDPAGDGDPAWDADDDNAETNFKSDFKQLTKKEEQERGL